MFNVLSTINWFSVLLAFAAYFMLGALWYLLLFPKKYRMTLGRDPEINPSQAPVFIIGPAVCAFIITITSALFMYALNISSVQDALLFACIAGSGYLFTNTVNIAINPNIPKPFAYGFITGGYHLVGMIMVCLIIVMMK